MVKNAVMSVIVLCKTSKYKITATYKAIFHMPTQANALRIRAAKITYEKPDTNIGLLV